MSNGSPWPKISIVTPSYNQGQFIEETIRSVLLQGYPNLEYFVIDGGSKDNTVEIIKKYGKWLTHWVSEPDKGQAHAINKGLERASGAVAAYLNSDDFYLPGALEHVGKTYTKPSFDVLVGRRKCPLPKLFLLRSQWWKNRLRPFVFPFILEFNCRYELPQECIFWSHRKFGKLRFDERYHFCLDVSWFNRIYSGARVVHTLRQLGFFRTHPENKSTRLEDLAKTEIQQIVSEAQGYLPRITEDAKQNIRSSFYDASRRAFFLRLLMPWKDFLFEYQHPAYLN